MLFGTADGQVIVMDCHGRMLAHILLHESDGIISMSWNCPSFLVEDSSESDTDSDDYSPPQGDSVFVFGKERKAYITSHKSRVCVFKTPCYPGDKNDGVIHCYFLIHEWSVVARACVITIPTPVLLS